ncbi:ABC transporter permease [Deinococcus radiopugnans]|uniref:ABC transporter permease n=2 Tax=Deinococcus radiopugnans TaxID=57497 RepID=A0A0A7KEC6_9DEIO|nr:branched-chain amino acid ABC transporter permease [Deinococcus radiopugnans]AIZ44532.1 ABC transporter permease [Deinococcus radiopugnans]MBB6016176.1 branched-chain amino acid transport system permease protein [Deinococcus radiopugnans ATCC 19172]QLG10154.1 branched-chain amino acid ABC transporter permease [Deinococcus sp. D7000]TNM72196.1 branched-chain amino acid ABC transporter permease [Deinococcus radiopugnans ATCC 19172]
MTVATPAKPAVRRPVVKPDRTILLVLFFVVTSVLLIISHQPGMMKSLGPFGDVLRNKVVEALVVSLFLANVLFAYLWKAANWAKLLVGIGSLLFVLPLAGQTDTSLLDLSIQIMIFAALALGLNIVVGLAGLLDLGYVAFFAVGAYTWSIFASPRFGEVLKYYGENPGATGSGTLAIGLVLTGVTAGSMLYIRGLHGRMAPTRLSSLSFLLAGFGLLSGIILVGRSILVLASGSAAAVASGINPGFFWLFLALSIMAAAIVGVLIGLPVLRLKGDYLAIITLGLGEVIRVLANNLGLYTAGSQGITPIGSAPVPWFNSLAGSLGFRPDQYSLLFLYVLVLIVIAVILLVNVRLDKSRIGRAWVAIRDDEIAAQAMGVPLMQTKLIAFATGASFAGVMGMIFAAKQTFISPESFNLLQSITVLSMVVLGGMGSFSGVILGAAVVTLLNLRILPGLGEASANVPWIPQEVNPANFNRFIFGSILVAMMLLRPEGLLPNKRVARELHHEDDQEDESEDGNASGLKQGGDVYSAGLATIKEDDRPGGER